MTCHQFFICNHWGCDISSHQIIIRIVCHWIQIDWASRSINFYWSIYCGEGKRLYWGPIHFHRSKSMVNCDNDTVCVSIHSFIDCIEFHWILFNKLNLWISSSCWFSYHTPFDDWLLLYSMMNEWMNCMMASTHWKKKHQFTWTQPTFK